MFHKVRSFIRLNDKLSIGSVHGSASTGASRDLVSHEIAHVVRSLAPSLLPTISIAGSHQALYAYRYPWFTRIEGQ